MSKIISFLIIISLVTSGCRPSSPSIERQAAELSHSLIENLGGAPSIGAIQRSADIATNVLCVTDRVKRRKIVDEWENALLRIPVANVPSLEQYEVVRCICETIMEDVSYARLKCGCFTVEEFWRGRFNALRWLDFQIERMRAECSLLDVDIVEAGRRWHVYQGISELRENQIERIERKGFNFVSKVLTNDSNFNVTGMFVCATGRPPRNGKDISRLGIYTRMVQERINAERNKALLTIRTNKFNRAVAEREKRNQ